MTITKQESDYCLGVAQEIVLGKIRSEVPGMFEGQAEEELPKHVQDIRDISDGVANALDTFRARQK